MNVVLFGGGGGGRRGTIIFNNYNTMLLIGLKANNGTVQGLLLGLGKGSNI